MGDIIIFYDENLLLVLTRISAIENNGYSLQAIFIKVDSDDDNYYL